MDFQLLLIITIFSVLFAESHAALSPKAYWTSVLPNTDMPKAVTDFLKPKTAMSVWKVGVGIPIKNGNKNYRLAATATQLRDRKVNVGIPIENGNKNYQLAASETQFKNGNKNYQLAASETRFKNGNKNYQLAASETQFKNGNKNYQLATSETQLRDRKVNVGIPIKNGNKNYRLAASVTQLHNSESETVYFLENDLKFGKIMSLDLTKKERDATFLTRSEAEKIPFSSEKMSDVFRLYGVKAGSIEAQTMLASVKECEQPGMKGEEKYCVTSLESMVDFSTSILGKNVGAISTEVNKETKLQKYTITGTSKMKANEAVVCHKEVYPYAVFFCHNTHNTKTYRASLVGADGSKANAVAICHTDTSAWNPRHLAFLMLNVKPGTVPICHFLPEATIIWVAKD